MISKLLVIAGMLTTVVTASPAMGQHWHGHSRGGHFDYHNGHIDFHQPAHLHFHRGHIDVHSGHFDHIYPSYSFGRYYDPYATQYAPTYFGNSYSFGASVPSQGVVAAPSTNPSNNLATPVNPLPGTTVVAGFAPNRGPINVINPAELGTTLAFTLNGQSFRLNPGEVKSVVFDRKYVIEFHRGGELGTARYSLRDGDFEFVISDQGGWDLKRQKKANQTPALDNSVLENPPPTGR